MKLSTSLVVLSLACAAGRGAKAQFSGVTICRGTTTQSWDAHQASAQNDLAGITGNLVSINTAAQLQWARDLQDTLTQTSFAIGLRTSAGLTPPNQWSNIGSGEVLAIGLGATVSQETSFVVPWHTGPPIEPNQGSTNEECILLFYNTDNYHDVSCATTVSTGAAGDLLHGLYEFPASAFAAASAFYGAGLCSFFASAGGDPHFLRWGQERHDSFHGECDMLLVSSAKQMFDVHLRTKIRKFYSFIKELAIRFGERIIEVDQTRILVDGGSLSIAHNTTAAAFPMVLQGRSGDHITIGLIGDKEYYIHWGSTSIMFSITGIFVNVNVNGGSDLADSVGLMGKYGTGEMLDRQGNPMDHKDVNAYGMEWQVKPDQGDPKLFSTVEGPQWPEQKCVMPDWTDPKKQKRRARRKLRGKNHGIHEAAKKACAGVFDFDLCVQDIVLTGEIGLAKAFV